MIVMEDLKTLGYKMAFRQQPLDFDHAAIVLKVVCYDKFVFNEVHHELFYTYRSLRLFMQFRW